MKRFQNILVAADTRHSDHPIVEEAASVAYFNRASLTIVDIVPEFTGSVKRKLSDHEYLTGLITKEKEEKLEQLAEPVRKKGIKVTTKLLRGKTSVEIVRQVVSGEYDLVFAVAKGQYSTQTGFFGQTATRLLRQCPGAVWLVASGTSANFKHVLGCVDTSSTKPLDVELNEKVYELSKSISQYHDSRFSILHAWTFQDEALLSNRLKPEALAEYEKDQREYTAKLFDTFLRQHDSRFPGENVHLIKGKPPVAIPDFVHENEVDLVVMGTVARSGLFGMITGNTAEKILGRIECSVLALKPYSFVSPISN